MGGGVGSYTDKQKKTTGGGGKPLTPPPPPPWIHQVLGLTPQQQPGSYQGGEMMMMKSVFRLGLYVSGGGGGSSFFFFVFWYIFSLILGKCYHVPAN